MPAGSKPQGDGLAIIFSAPSGAGKTTLVRHLMSKPDLALGFSVSATTRGPRKGEKDGVDYHFLSAADFAEKVKNGEFVEYEEVYEGLSYGTLCSEVERLWRDGRTPLFDVDVVGGQTLKAVFGEEVYTCYHTSSPCESMAQVANESNITVAARVNIKGAPMPAGGGDTGAGLPTEILIAVIIASLLGAGCLALTCWTCARTMNKAATSTQPSPT